MASSRRALVGLSRSWNSHVMAGRTPFNVFSIMSRICCRPQFGSVRSYSFGNDIQNQSLDINFANEESRRRILNRLLYRSKQRGFLELDLVLGKWVEEHIYQLDENGIKALVDVLDLENPELWKWLTSQEHSPDAVNANPVFCSIREKVTDSLSHHAAAATRAMPGQPWVRGWDDFKKARDGGPISGNQ